jgi:methyltransferase family protein
VNTFELLQLRLRTLTGLPRAAIEDARWLDLQSKPALARKLYGIRLPGLPPDDVQRRFTGDTGRSNLLEAFNFYKFACSASAVPQRNDLKILDFGGGWGRVSRFFLRDTRPDHIWIVDCTSEAMHWLRQTGNPCNVIQNEPLPPIKGIPAGFDLVFAFSVFSHLSEHFLRSWLDYLLGLLAPGGHLVFTTRGCKFIELVERRRQKGNFSAWEQSLPHADEMRARHASGAFQFYPAGGGSELTSDFYGEALVPRRYFEAHYGAALIQFTEQVENVPQAVVVLRKPASA